MHDNRADTSVVASASRSRRQYRSAEFVDPTDDLDDMMELDESPLIAATGDCPPRDSNAKKRQLDADPHTPSKTRRRTQLSTQDPIDDTPNYGPGFTPSQQWRQELITPMERLKLTKKSENMNLDEPWWQYEFISRALEAVAPVTADDESETNTTPTKPSPSKRKGKKSDQKPTRFETLAGTAEKTSVYDSINYLNADTIVWNEELKASDLPNRGANDPAPLIKVTSDSLKAFDDQQSWFDKIKYQREDHLKACEILNIENPDVPKLPGMRLSTAFHFWQPVAIKALMEFSKNALLRGAILADVVGLGKTWTSIGYLMAVSLPI